jgi:hypothetical protein
MAVVCITGGPRPAMMWCCGDGMMGMDMDMPMDMRMHMDMPMEMGDCPHCAGM